MRAVSLIGSLIDKYLAFLENPELLSKYMSSVWFYLATVNNCYQDRVAVAEQVRVLV